MPLQNICRNFFIIEQRDSISRYDSHLIITVLSVIMYTWRKPDPLTMEMQALASLECKSQSPRVVVWWGVRESLCKFREVNKYLSWQQRKKKKWRRQWIDYALVSPMQFVKLHLTIDHFLPGNLQEKFSSFALFRKKKSFFELNFNVTNHSENQASSPTSSTQRINVIRHTFWLSSLVKGWPQKNRPAGHPNKKRSCVSTILQPLW